MFCKLMFILKGKGCHIFSHNLQFNVCTDYFENTFRLNEQPQIEIMPRRTKTYMLSPWLGKICSFTKADKE